MAHDPSSPQPMPAAEDVREMACTFAEEFARMGHDGPKILRMFQNPFYTGAYDVYRALGHTATAAIIDQCLAGGRTRVTAQPAGKPARRPTPTGGRMG